MRETVSKEIDKKLPQAGRPRIFFHTWWFKQAWQSRNQPWRYLKFKFFMKARNANAMNIWIGPFHIVYAQRWLEGPARQHHPEVFASDVPSDGESNGNV